MKPPKIPSKRSRGTANSSTPGTPADDIVRAAAHLFAEQGFSKTTITQIAHAAGMHQSSIYYWFSSKEAILHAALAINRKAVTFAAEHLTDAEPAGQRLYRLLRFDTLQLCLSALDFNEVEQIAEVQPDGFSDFWIDYHELHECVTALICEGIAAGAFHSDIDPEIAATAALCLDEGIQKRYRNRQSHTPDAGNPFTIAPRSAEEYAAVSARTSLSALLRNPEEVKFIVASAEAIDHPNSPADDDASPSASPAASG